MSHENQNGVTAWSWGTDTVPSHAGRLLAWPGVSLAPYCWCLWDNSLTQGISVSILFPPLFFLCSYCWPRRQDLHTQLEGRHPLRRLWEKPQTSLHRGTEPAGDPEPSRRLGSFWYVREEGFPTAVKHLAVEDRVHSSELPLIYGKHECSLKFTHLLICQ